MSGVLATRVIVRFQQMRAKLVDGRPITPSGLTATLDVDPLKSHLVASTVAMVARVRNDSPNRQQFIFSIEGQPVCAKIVASHSTTRIDCAWNKAWSSTTRNRIEVVASETPWTLTYLEIATHHGSTRGHDVFILPDSFDRRAGPDWLVVMIFFGLMASVMVLPLPSMWNWVSIVYRAACGIVAVLFVLIAVSPIVSSFLVVISVGLFSKCVAVVTVPRLWQAAIWSRRHRTHAWRLTIVSATAATLVIVAYGPLMLRLLDEEFDWNYSGFLRMSRARFDAHPTLSTHDDLRSSLILQDDDGYDGQFGYYAVHDPLLREFRGSPATYMRFIDEPSYRYGRIGFSWLTRLVTGNRWQQYPATMAWLIFGGLLATLVALMSIASTANNSPILAALVVFIPAFYHSVQVGLPEPIAAALLVGGYACWTRGMGAWAGVFFAASLLVRETGGVLILCVTAADLMAGNRRLALTLGGLAFLPLILWRGYVALILAPAVGAGDVWHSAGVLGLPFTGIVTLWTVISQGQYFGGRWDFGIAGIWFPLLVMFGLGIAAWLVRRRVGPVATAALVYGSLAVSMTYDKVWEHISNGQRGTFELFLMLAIVSVGDTSQLPRPLKAALASFWVATAGYVFYGAFDAPYIRDAIIQVLLRRTAAP